MSGGVAYVWDREGVFLQNCNLGMVELETVEADDDVAELYQMIENHHKHTGSTVAQQILDDWQQALSEFVKVMPVDYKRVLMGHKAREDESEKAQAEEDDAPVTAGK
jgi:glutamate synthase (NADPH/NADH) large chain